jgi:membrane-bound lytic murein transglycosylase B
MGAWSATIPMEVYLRRPKTRTTVLSALGLAGTAGALGIALVGGPALADPTPSASTSPAPSTSAAPDHRAGHAQRQEELAAALATELGIDKEKVAAALEKVQAARRAENRAENKDRTPAKADPAKRIEDLKARLDAAVKEGKLTAEESAAILKAAEAGVLPHGRGGGPGR